jgi:serine/threonine protein kinase/lipopolysaccharide biosynthesis regulator YciM
MIRRERWLQIQSLFEQMLDVDAGERASRLTAACSQDTDLRRSVESLLAADDSRTDPLPGVIGDAAGSLLEHHRDRLIGACVGPFRITAILGHGGMSTVYRAERIDAHHPPTVAIKVLHHATLHPRMRSRLQSERHILGSLDHPSIARLIDSGELEDGTPYLVMEHVAGELIDVYCDQRSMPVPERLELMLQVCGAVQFAHRNLVVHRDIKASNIIVTKEGTPKLLDFGIAKLLAPEGMSHTVPVTRLQERMLTPENAAPEQVLGRRITTATDIYALGVLLYQLLTGRSPYRLRSYSQLQLERAICMDEPLRPSQVVIAGFGREQETDRQHNAARRGLTPERLRARIAGDLDAIVAKAMRKEPERRYASVEAFADDLKDHLTGRPVAARHGDRAYLAGRFLRRHALAVGIVAATFCGLSGVVTFTLWQNHRIEAEREATARERDRAREVSAFLVDVFSQADPFTARGKEPTAKELLDRGAAKIQDNVTLQPEVRAQLLDSIGLAYRRQGLSDRAIPLFEQALAIRRLERPLDQRRVAVALANLASALTDAGSLVSAEAYLQQALEISRRANGANSVDTADILMQFGHLVLNGESRPQRAIELFGEALSIYRTTLGSQNLVVASTLDDLAAAAVWLDDFASGERYERESLRIFQENAGRSHPDYAVALATLGHILTERGRYDEAERMLKEAYDIDSRVFGADNQRVADIESHLAVLYARRGDFARALEAAAHAVRISTGRLGLQHYLTGYYLDSLAELLLRTGDSAGAERNARQALSVYSRSLPARHLYVASARQLLGEILLTRGSLAEAEAEARAAAELCGALAGPDNWRTARANASLGWILIERGRAFEGEPLLAGARERLLSSLGATNPATQLASTRLADYYRSRRREGDAARVAGDPAVR